MYRVKNGKQKSHKGRPTKRTPEVVARKTELHDGTLMRVDGDMEFRIYCEDIDGGPFHIITEGGRTNKT
jgi:hypothetical protein